MVYSSDDGDEECPAMRFGPVRAATRSRAMIILPTQLVSRICDPSCC